MYDNKNWYESKSIWGALGTVVVAILGLFGKQIDPALVNDTLVYGAAVVGGAVSVYGRIKASKVIK